MQEWNLCCEKPAGEGRCPAPQAALMERQPFHLALAFLYDVAAMFEEDPLVFCGAGDTRATALFRGSRCVCGDFIEVYAPMMAAISHHWPVTVYGTIQGTEIGSLRAEWCDGEIRWTMCSGSGKPFHTLGELCVQINMGEDTLLGEALKGLSCRQCVISLDRGRSEGLAKRINGAWFAYVDLLENVSNADRLYALSMEQKEALWELYLGEGFSPLEFEWLWEYYESGDADGMLEWELALQTALERLDIRVENDAKGFHITGEYGHFRLDYITAPAAGKLFLKALFPVSFPR